MSEPRTPSRASEGGAPLTRILQDAADKLHTINASRLARGAHNALQTEPWSWFERSLDLESRAHLLTEACRTGERPGMDRVLAVVAAGLAYALAVDAAELADPVSGEEAA